MRSMLAACVVLCLAVLVLSRSVQAGPPMPTEARAMKDVLPTLKSLAQKPMLAAARYAADVFKVTTVQARPWNNELDLLSPSMNAITQRGCAALSPEELKASNALLEEYGATLPPFVHAFALGQKGKTSEAGDLFVRYADLLSGPVLNICPNEHPSVSYERFNAMQLALKCLMSFEPKRDVTRVRKQVEKAKACAVTNTAVG
jgi:hypothetical protein